MGVHQCDAAEDLDPIEFLLDEAFFDEQGGIHDRAILERVKTVEINDSIDGLAILVGFAGAELRKPAGDGGLAAFEAVGLGVGVGSLAFLAMSSGLAVSASAATAAPLPVEKCRAHGPSVKTSLRDTSAVPPS